MPVASRVRYGVLGFLCALSMITYLDRACFGAVAPTLAAELSLSGVADLKWAFTAFAIAYAVFEIPTGWLGDMWGPRGTLLRIVIWWSAFTALTGAVGLRIGPWVLGGLGTLIVLRFLFGAGEAGAFPNIARAVHNWFPSEQAATAQGWIWMSGRLAGGLTPMIWTLLVMGTLWTPAVVTWRGAFALFGLIGLAWCIGFAWFFRDRPRDHPLVNEAERIEIERDRDISAVSHGIPPMARMLGSANLWLLCIMYFCMVYGWYFHVTYLPAYLQDRFDVDPQSLVGALYKGAPLWIGAFSSLAGGILVDWLIRRIGNRKRARRLMGMTAEGLCAIGWIAAMFAPNVHLFVLAISLAALCNDMTLASAWATCQDIGGRFTAVTAACMNTVGAIGAAIAAWATGTIIELSLAAHAFALHVDVEQLSQSEKHAATMAGFQNNFMTFAAVYFVAAVCWRFIDADKPIVPAEHPMNAS
jgi:MFS transporter, ACS family, glucarate transporter